MTPYQRILIVRTDRMGDVVLTTPSIEALRGAFPQAQIDILVSIHTVNLVNGNPFLNNVIVDDRKGKHKGFRGYLKLVYEIRERKYDLAIIFHTKKRTNLLMFLARVPQRLGYFNNKLGFLLTQKIKDVRHLGQKHEVEYCLDLLAEIGIKPKKYGLYLPIQLENEQYITEVFKKNSFNEKKGLLAIHPGGSDITKRWPVYRFVELIDALADKYADNSIVLIGGIETKQISSQIVQNVKEKDLLFDLTGKFTLGQLVSLLKRCKLLISNDSGPVHVADAVGTAVVSIFTRNQPGINPQRWKPFSSRSRFVAPAFIEHISFSNPSKTDLSYLELVQTKQVLEAVDSIFKLC